MSRVSAWFQTPRGGEFASWPAWMRWPPLKLAAGPLLATAYYLFCAYLAIFRRRCRVPGDTAVLDRLYGWRAWSPLEPFWPTNRGLTVLAARGAEMPDPVVELGAQNCVISAMIFGGRRIAYGTDIDPRWIESLNASGHFERTALMDASAMPFDDGQLGSVVLFNAIYHMDRDAVLRELHRVLAPGGTLVLTDAPNYAKIHPVHRLLRQLGLYGRAERYRRWVLKAHSISTLVPAEAWRSVDGFDAVALVPFGGMEMTRLSRVGYAFFYDLAPLGAPPCIARPYHRVALLRNIVRAARTAYWDPAVLDDASAREHCSLLVVLRKRGTFAAPAVPRRSCPVCRAPLPGATCAAGHAFPVRDGCEVLLPNWEEALR